MVNSKTLSTKFYKILALYVLETKIATQASLQAVHIVINLSHLYLVNNSVIKVYQVRMTTRTLVSAMGERECVPSRLSPAKGHRHKF